MVTRPSACVDSVVVAVYSCHAHVRGRAARTGGVGGGSMPHGGCLPRVARCTRAYAPVYSRSYACTWHDDDCVYGPYYPPPPEAGKLERTKKV